MNPLSAWSIVVATAILTGLAFVIPGPWVVALALLATALMASTGFALFGASAAVINSFLLGFLVQVEPTTAVGPWAFSVSSATQGAFGAARMVAAVGVNALALKWAQPARLLDGLHLPPFATGLAGALLLAATDIGQDAKAMLQNSGQTRWQRARNAASLLPAVLVLAHRRARTRREALWLVGHPTPPWFVPLVAITATAIAGRLAFVALPNLALTYVLVFLGGLAYGARLGAASAALAMTLTNLMLSGLVPSSFVNVPAMALVGAAGGWLRHVSLEGASGRVLAGAVGVLATMVFSVVTDALTWALIAEFRTSIDLLKIRIAAGLAFNAMPALTNGVLFAAAAGPVQRAFSNYLRER